jgi:threonine/homoserine/homoserine lactone efflux protein
MNNYKNPGKVLFLLSVLATFAAALDAIGDITIFNLGANSWLLISIALAVYGLTAKHWKMQKEIAQS